MFCPQCKAEYRQGFTRCADCEVELVVELPIAAMVPRGRHESDEANETDEARENSEDPFCEFWKGEDPRIHAEICELLDQEGIPHKTVRREDHLFKLSTNNAFRVGIPFSLFDKAEAAISEAYGSDDDRPPEASEEELWPLALPESTGAGEVRRRWNPENFYPEDATVEVWSSEDLYPGEVIALALRENQVLCRFDKGQGKKSICVLPEDEERAREIVREIVEGTPPE